MFLKGICLILVFASPVWSDYINENSFSGLRLQLPAELNLNNLFYKPTKASTTRAPPSKDDDKKRPWHNYPPYYPAPWWQSYYPYYPPYGPNVPRPTPKPTTRPPTNCQRFPTSPFCTPTPPTGWQSYCRRNPTTQFCQALLPPQGWCLLVPTYPNCDIWPAITTSTKLCDVASFLAECQTTPPSDATVCETVPDLPACNVGTPTPPLYCGFTEDLVECRLCSWNPTATGCEVCATTTPDPAICP